MTAKRFLNGGENLKVMFILETFWPSWLFELSERYDSQDANLGNLLMKVDVVPISLAWLKLQLRAVGEPQDI